MDEGECKRTEAALRPPHSIFERGVMPSSLLGLAVGLGFAVPPMVLTASDAEAETAGMERRQVQRPSCTERRTGRHERRTERRGGSTAPAQKCPALCAAVMGKAARVTDAEEQNQQG